MRSISFIYACIREVASTHISSYITSFSRFHIHSRNHSVFHSLSLSLCLFLSVYYVYYVLCKYVFMYVRWICERVMCFRYPWDPARLVHRRDFISKNRSRHPFIDREDRWESRSFRRIILSHTIYNNIYIFIYLYVYIFIHLFIYICIYAKVAQRTIFESLLSKSRWRENARPLQMFRVQIKQQSIFAEYYIIYFRQVKMDSIERYNMYAKISCRKQRSVLTSQ